MALTTVNPGLLDGQAQYTGFKNRIINGAMMIDQRNAGASVTVGAGGTYLVDRWQAIATQGSRLAAQQNYGAVTPPTGFTNYLGFQSSSAYSVISSDYFGIRQQIEGLNISDLAWGTASAQTVTLSFCVYSSLTGTFGGSLGNSALNRTYPFTYTVSSANTWTTVSITIPGDTSGTWLTTNGIGIGVNFSLGTGTTSSGTAGTWASAGYLSATGAVSVVGTSGATFYITGVQLEKGSTATSFDYRPYGTELALCQRYYEKSFDQNVVPQPSSGAGREIRITYGDSAGYHYWTTTYKVTKRSAPTVSMYASATTGSVQVFNGNYTGSAAVTLDFSGTNGFLGHSYSYSANSVSACYYCWTAESEL